ncbi:MAG: hypothetical protein GY789_20630 [Hyphomicrobiales bacterium]|nr:hypothetical protein [Hyphomicrobiales bacterium]
MTEGAAPDGELARLENELVTDVEGDTLNTMVLSALNFRRLGRIDQSIQLITRANKMQLDAIEALQGIMDTLHGRPKQQVVFSKYRQFSPFEMGIEEADDVLRLIASMEDGCAGDAKAQRERLHELEAHRNAELERLNFFEQRFGDGSEDDTIEESRTKLEDLSIHLLGAKHKVLNVALSTTQSFLVLIGEQANISPAHYEVPRCLYILATSPTRTRHADDVQTEKGA